jgi:N utilization substance protein B
VINRRLIRIKVFQTLFSEFAEHEENSRAINSKVEHSILGLQNNLLGVLSFGPQLAHFLEKDKNPTEFKFNPTSDDIKSFKLFTSNHFINAVANNPEINDYMNKPTLDWNAESETLFLIYKQIKQSNPYKIAMAQTVDEQVEITFAKSMYKYLILESVEFEELLEDRILYWYDEKIPILKSLERIFDKFDKTSEIQLPALFKDKDEDLRFARELVETYLEHKEEVVSYINEYTPGWDSDRITKTDFILMTMALCEFKYMPMIPVKVTLNEYIEIAKMYSTPKSSKFVNGTLDKILQDWKKENLIQKKGRGLIG